MSRSRRPSRGLQLAREKSRERILSGHADKEAGIRYAKLAELWPSMAEDFKQRAIICERLASQKLRSIV